MKETKVICDGCGNEISTTTCYESEAYLSLNNVWKYHEGDMVFAMALYPPIKNDMQFHGLECLKTWINKDGKEAAA